MTAAHLPALIGLSGYAGVGKDAVRTILCRDHGYEGAAFADRLRAMARELNPYFVEAGQTYVELVDTLTYDEAKRRYPCVRDYLVRLGHGARTHLSPTVWLDAVLPPPEWKRPLPAPRLVISDVRYMNEAMRIQELGGVVIRIYRPGVEAAHPTEYASLALAPYNLVLENNGKTLEELAQAVTALFTTT